MKKLLLALVTLSAVALVSAADQCAKPDTAACKEQSACCCCKEKAAKSCDKTAAAEKSDKCCEAKGEVAKTAKK